MSAVIGSDPSFTPAEFVAVFNQSLEMMYGMVVIVGELGNYRVSRGMWVYFDLKDEVANIRFFGTTRQLPGPLEDGMQLEVTGRPYLHPKFGFSIQVMSIRPVGEGTIRKAQDLLTTKLQTEGLFDEARKRTLPYPPERIALVTSREAAAYSDFIKVIGKRWPRLIVELFDVQVQGRDAPQSLTKAIEEANQSSELYDALVMIRGGGSTDDLAAFSTEQVVRAVAASRIPTVVAIGHERDISLAELAADMRASTPGNAAELLVPEQTAEKHRLKIIEKQITQIILSKYKDLKNEISEYEVTLTNAISMRINEEVKLVVAKSDILRLLNPEMPLRRGFALVRTPQGQLIRSVRQVAPKVRLELQVSDGKIITRVE